MSKVAVIITIPEGDDGAAGCVEECQRQVDIVSSEGRYSFSIYLNDGEDGYLAAWDKASKDGADFYLWLDHDLSLAEGAIACLLENSEFLRHKAVITGTVSRPDKSLLFGGRTRRGKLIEPDPVIPVPCHLFDMSVALVPDYAFRSLDNPSDFFRKSLWYYGFGKRLSKAGVARMTAPGILAQTARKLSSLSWRDPEIGLFEKVIRFLRSLFK